MSATPKAPRRGLLGRIGGAVTAAAGRALGAALKAYDAYCTLRSRHSIVKAWVDEKQSFSAVRLSIGILMRLVEQADITIRHNKQIERRESKTFIEKYGKPQTAHSQRDMLSIIQMETCSIMPSKTFTLFRIASIPPSITRASVHKSCWSTCGASSQKQGSITKPRKAGEEYRSARKHATLKDCRLRKYVSNAVKHLRTGVYVIGELFVRGNVSIINGGGLTNKSNLILVGGQHG